MAGNPPTPDDRAAAARAAAADLVVFDALAHLVRALVLADDEQAPGVDLVDLVERAGSSLGARGGGVAIDDGRGVRSVAVARDRASRAAEQGQQALGEGPCVEVIVTGAVVTATDLREDDRWPAFGPLAVDAGVRAVAALPLGTPERVIGAFDVYAAEPRAWTPRDLAVAELFAGVITARLLNADRFRAFRGVNDQLHQALRTRVVVEQAKGVLAEREGITVDQAFRLLRRHARNRRAPLRAVAEDVVSGRLRLPAREAMRRERRSGAGDPGGATEPAR